MGKQPESNMARFVHVILIALAVLGISFAAPSTPKAKDVVPESKLSDVPVKDLVGELLQRRDVKNGLRPVKTELAQALARKGPDCSGITNKPNGCACTSNFCSSFNGGPRSCFSVCKSGCCLTHTGLFGIPTGNKCGSCRNKK